MIISVLAEKEVSQWCGRGVNNFVQLSNVSFDSNTAQFGGGLFLEFLDNATNNKVVTVGCEKMLHYFIMSLLLVDQI